MKNIPKIIETPLVIKGIVKENMMDIQDKALRSEAEKIFAKKFSSPEVMEKYAKANLTKEGFEVFKEMRSKQYRDNVIEAGERFRKEPTEEQIKDELDKINNILNKYQQHADTIKELSGNPEVKLKIAKEIGDQLRNVQYKNVDSIKRVINRLVAIQSLLDPLVEAKMEAADKKGEKKAA
jgi:pentatricopeptide repeat protein